MERFSDISCTAAHSQVVHRVVLEQDRSNSGALNDRSQSGPGAQLKARSQSAVAAAHVLENKAALLKLTQHHQEDSQRKLYDRCCPMQAPTR